MIRRSLFATALIVVGIALWAGAPEARTVSVSDVSADPGQAGVTVSVSVDSARGIAGGDLTLSYDPGVLTAREVRAGSLLTPAGITVISNTGTAGRVIVSMAGATGMAAGAGALVTMVFDVKAGAASGVYDLSLEAALRDEAARAIPVTVRKGALTVRAVGRRTVSVSDVSADPGQTGITVSVGVDSAKGIAGGDLTLSYDPGVLTVREVRAGSLLTPAGITTVSNLSAAGQVKVSMAGANGLASGGGALLVTAVFDVRAGAASGAYDLNIEAALRDEAARAIPVTVRKGVLTVRAVGRRTVSVSDVSADPGQTGITVSVGVDSAKGIAGGDLTLSYDANVLTVREVRAGSLLTPAGITVVSNLSAAGQVKVSMAGVRGIASGGGALLVTAVFDVRAGAASGAYDLNIEAALRDESGKAIPVTVRKGVLTVNPAGGVGVARRGVSVSDVSVDPGQAGATASILVDDARGIAGGDLTLTYDPGVLTVREVRAGSLLTPAGITLISNINAAGQVVVSMAGARGIASVAGALLTAVFDVKAGAAPGVYDIGLQATLRDENGRAIPATLRKGALTVRAAGEARGRVLAVSDVSVNPGQTGVAVPVGVDSARGVAGGDLTLTYEPGVLTAKEVTAGGLLVPTGITMISNISTAGQVIVSMAGALGLTSGSGTLLVTVVFDVKAGAAPGAYDIGLEATLRDEAGRAVPLTVRKGTLTIKATPSGPLTPRAGDGTGGLGVKDQRTRALGGIKPGQRVDVPIFFNQEVAGATGFQVVLTFDPKKLSVVSGKGEGVFASAIFPGPPQVRDNTVTYAGSFLGTSVTAKGALAVLTFQASGDFSGETEIVLRTLSIRVLTASRDFKPEASVVLSSGAVAGGGPPSPDFDGDGEVSFSDFFLFSVAFGQKATGDNAKFDLDEDGEVSFGDFFIFSVAFGKKV